MHKWVLFVLLMLPANLQAANAMDGLPEAQKLGKARMSVLFWDVYDATLYTSNAEPFSFEKPFALKLDYLMELKGNDIAERSVEEIRGLGYSDEVKLAAWYSQMSEIFPNVKEGSELVGVYNPQKPTDFYQNGQHIGTVRDPEFGQWFFGIWLAENTSDPSFRSKLVSAK